MNFDSSVRRCGKGLLRRSTIVRSSGA